MSLPSLQSSNQSTQSANDENDKNNDHSSNTPNVNTILIWVGVACGVLSICAVLYYYSRRKLNINERNIQRILSEGRISPQISQILKNR